MKLQNGYKVIYEKIADGERTFFADKMDGTDATQLGDAIQVGKYKLVFEKDGQIYGSETGKTEDGVCLKAFNEVFVDAEEEEVDEPMQTNVEPENEEPDVDYEGDDEGESETDPEDEE
jgi:hypothetical protein